MSTRTFSLFVLLWCLALPASAQTTATQTISGASLLQASIAAMTNGTLVNDVTLTGTATRTAGADVETGAVTLKALGGGEGRIDLTLTNGQRSEIINQSAGAPAGQWSGPDGLPRPMSLHNCWTPASWFFPALVLGAALNNPAVTFAYVGQETRDGVAVQHVRFSRAVPQPSPKIVALIERLSAVDVYLDAATSLPVALDFNIHPDSNAELDIPVEIQFSDYQKLNGVLTPTHIQKLINHSLVLELQVTGATMNSNLSQADFAVQTQ